MMLICPICREQFIPPDKKRLVCPNGHSFDISSAGHCNLLISQKSGDKTGDNKEMVLARRLFLDKDYYKPLAERMSQFVLAISKHNKSPKIVDAGCGEGYYTRIITKNLLDSGKTPEVIGVDISKNAAMAAAKRDKNTFYITASAFAMPVKDKCADVVLSLFAPLCSDEFGRVLKDGGTVLCAVPGEMHLWELKAAVYDAPYKNQEDKYRLDGFSERSREKISYKLTIDDAESIQELFAMTPYAFKTSKTGLERLKKLNKLEVTLEFLIIQFVKVV